MNRSKKVGGLRQNRMRSPRPNPGASSPSLYLIHPMSLPYICRTPHQIFEPTLPHIPKPHPSGGGWTPWTRQAHRGGTLGHIMVDVMRLSAGMGWVGEALDQPAVERGTVNELVRIAAVRENRPSLLSLTFEIHRSLPLLFVRIWYLRTLGR